MSPCAQCGVHVPVGARFCPGCGAAQSSISQMPTAMPSSPEGSRRAVVSSPPIGRLDSSSSFGAFAPGQVLAERYRIIGLLGRGGMGEVYRADDLKLGQPVALKFLPKHFAKDAALLDRFHAEVRNARQVAHPNVCRVYDIGEIDGHHYLTMEYVDGEELSTLLRRIGRFAPAKALDIARQLCAGLAAAHEKGVLHRDLKPSNVMLDGHGRVRITDFGLALRTEEAQRGEIAGTPAYMPPEQFEGQPFTVQSDLYSLGLVLYEIYTGKKTFEAASFQEWKSRHTQSQPTAPSNVEAEIDAAVERAILRCLEKDPAKRPASAMQLSASLPGGDPLAAALAAGETPSPEMVAAAGGEGALSARAAWSLLTLTLVLILACLLVAPYSTDLGLDPMEKSPDVLRDRARQIVAGLGYDRDPADSADWLERDYAPMRYLADHLPSQQWRHQMRQWGAPVLFHYRQSPQAMHPANNGGGVTASDPAFEIAGMARVDVDAEGRLRCFQAVPPQQEPPDAPAKEADWAALFTEAGLDRQKFQPAKPEWVPPAAFDARGEWTGVAPWAPEIPLRVAAAAWRGRAVYFEVLGPWSRPLRQEEQRLSTTQRITIATGGGMVLILFGVAVFFAQRNIRMGRGDRKGAWRLATFLFCLSFLHSVFVSHHTLTLQSLLAGLLRGLGGSSALAIVAWLFYLAVEPFIRRRMPEVLIGWTRALEGRFRDARVGRDLLIGGLAGAIFAFIIHVTNALPTWFSFPGQTTVPPDPTALAGGRYLVAGLVQYVYGSAAIAIVLLCALFALRRILRHATATLIAMAVLCSVLNLGGENVKLETPGAILLGILMAVVLTRFGVLAFVALWYFRTVLLILPLSLQFSLWFAVQAGLALLVPIALAIYAFRISFGSRPVFATLDD